MEFRRWLVERLGNEADQMPASAEVIRTGLQPQVDAQEIRTRQKDELDLVQAIDSHLQRIRTIVDDIGDVHTRKLLRAKKFCEKVLRRWDGIKKDEQKPDDRGLDGFEPDEKRARWMKQNQPLPENPRIAGPGTFGSFGADGVGG